jgi:hypothetical protein
VIGRNKQTPLGLSQYCFGYLTNGVIYRRYGMLSGIRNSIMPSSGNGQTQQQGQGQGQQQGQGQGQQQGQGQGAQQPAIPVTEQLPEVRVNAGTQMTVRNGTQVISGADSAGNPTFAAPSGSGAAARGPDVAIIENAPATTNPAFRYTGHVENNQFVITSVQAVRPGSTPPEMGLPVRLDTPVKLDITNGANNAGSINLTQAAGTPLAAARAQATERATSMNQGRQYAITERGNNTVSVTLDPVVRDGASFQTTLIGTRGADGLITFNRATMTETRGGVQTDVIKPGSTSKEFNLGQEYFPNPVASAGTPPTVTLLQGQTGKASEDLVNFTMNGRRQVAAQQDAARTARGTEITTALGTAPDAPQALNKLATTLDTQFKNSGMNPLESNMASETVANFYSKAENRGATFNADALRAQLTANTREDPANPARLRSQLTPRQIDAIVTEVGSHHTQISNSINTKPISVGAGAAAGAAPVQSTGRDITRAPVPSAQPTPGTPVSPNAIPGIGAGGNIVTGP